jgi:hypothetical protein
VSLTQTTPSTRASIRAIENVQANARALDLTEIPSPGGEFLFGRDGYLTLRDASGAWHTGCSLPHRAAQAMLKKMPVSGRVACFLGPTHAAHLRVALDQLRFDQAIIAIMPEQRDFEIALHCEDFSKDIANHRLFFASGEGWADELVTTFRNHPGLAPPSHFVRLATLSENACDLMMRDAQKVFSSVASERAERIKTVWRERSLSKRDEPRVCVIAASGFRLWDDAGHALASIVGDDASIVRLDPDDPASTSSLAVAMAASKADAIVSANMYRGDAPAGVVPESMPWITWVTNARVPALKSAASRDRLIVVDEATKARALASGWIASRIDVAGWPVGRCAEPLSREAAVICDVPSLECPEKLAEYSSFTLLWDAIVADLQTDPTKLRDVDQYLATLRRQLSISEEGFPRAAFIDGCIVPAWQIGWVNALLRAKAPLRLYGRGWEMPESRGPIETREQLQCALAHGSCLLDLWPTNLAQHPIHFTGRRVVAPFGKSVAQIITALRNHGEENSVRHHFFSPHENSVRHHFSSPLTRELLDRILSM